LADWDVGRLLVPSNLEQVWKKRYGQHMTFNYFITDKQRKQSCTDFCMASLGKIHPVQSEIHLIMSVLTKGDIVVA
jgi:hypothetical protein